MHYSDAYIKIDTAKSISTKQFLTNILIPQWNLKLVE